MLRVFGLLRAVPMPLVPWFALTILALAVSSYVLGRGHGYDSGIRRGQAEVQKLLDKETERVADLQEAVRQLGAEASRAWLAWYAEEQSKEEPRTEIVVQWKERLVPGTCGLSEATTEMINDLMNLDQ